MEATARNESSELHFAVGEALAYAIARKVPTESKLFDIEISAEDPLFNGAAVSFSADTDSVEPAEEPVGCILKHILEVSLADGNKYGRCAGAIWALSMVKHCAEDPVVVEVRVTQLEHVDQ